MTDDKAKRDFIQNSAHKLMTSARLALAELSSGGNTKRTRLWDEFGYPMEADFFTLHRMYRRHSVAAAGVNVTLETCWTDYPTILDGDSDDDSSYDTAWEVAANALLKKYWSKIKDADRRNLVGRYSALFIQVRDNQTLDQPITGKLEPSSIVRMVPIWEAQLKVSTTQEDQTKADYGMPTMYSFTPDRQDDSISVIQPQQIHPSRLIIFAEGSEDGSLNSGVPLNQAGFNDLLDIEKSKGGSAEGFLKNASRQIAIQYDAAVQMEKLSRDAKAAGYDDLYELLNESIAELNMGTDSALITQSGTATVLSVATADPTPTWTVSAQSYAASIMCPFNILFGKQTGNLASTEDNKAWNSRCNGRRNGFLTDRISDVINWLVTNTTIGAPTRGTFTVSWSDLLSPSDSDRLANMQIMATVMMNATTALGRCPFDGNELRAVGGFDPEEDDVVSQPMPEADPDAGEQS